MLAVEDEGWACEAMGTAARRRGKPEARRRDISCIPVAYYRSRHSPAVPTGYITQAPSSHSSTHEEMRHSGWITAWYGMSQTNTQQIVTRGEICERRSDYHERGRCDPVGTGVKQVRTRLGQCMR